LTKKAKLLKQKMPKKKNVKHLKQKKLKQKKRSFFCQAFFVRSVFQISFLFNSFGKELLRFFCFSKTIKIDEKKEKIRQIYDKMLTKLETS